MSNKNRVASSNYRKPPVEHQFKKGKSGNPMGRPPKKSVQPGGGAAGIVDRVAAMALEEAIRPVRVREGGKVSEIPAMQALLRAMFRSAAQGDAKAARQLTELISRVESGRASSASEMLRHAARYKETYSPIFEKHEREGLNAPEIFPHPDDVIIDEATGAVTIDGPTTREEAGALAVGRDHVLTLLPRYVQVQMALKKDPKNKALRREFKELSKYWQIAVTSGDRIRRHEILRLSRRGLETKRGETAAIPGSGHEDREG